MEIAALVAQLEAQGASLDLNGEKVRLRAPADHAPSPEVLEMLRREKQALVAFLRERKTHPQVAPCGSPNCGRCYSVGDGRKIHPPKTGLEYREWLERWEGKGRVQ